MVIRGTISVAHFVALAAVSVFFAPQARAATPLPSASPIAITNTGTAGTAGNPDGGNGGTSATITISDASAIAGVTGSAIFLQAIGGAGGGGEFSGGLCTAVWRSRRKRRSCERDLAYGERRVYISRVLQRFPALVSVAPAATAVMRAAALLRMVAAVDTRVMQAPSRSRLQVAHRFRQPA